MKILNSISYNIDSWGYPIMTGMHLDFMLLITALWAEHFIQFSAQHVISLSSLCLISLWGCSWRRCQKSEFTILSTPVSQEANHFIVKGYQLCQAWLTAHNSMLTTPSCLLVLHMSRNDFQSYLFCTFQHNGSEAHWLIAHWIFLLLFLKRELIVLSDSQDLLQIAMSFEI